MVANFEDKTKKNNSSQQKTPHPPVQKATALRYDNTKDAAPKVVAKGKQHIAEKIIEIAKEHKIPIHRDSDLVNVLEAVEINQEIPLEVYTVVAEIFSYLYRINKTQQNRS